MGRCVIADTLVWYIYSSSNWFKGVHAVSHGSSWISTIDGVRKQHRWMQGQYKQYLYIFLLIVTLGVSQQWTACEKRQITSHVWGRPMCPLVTSRFRARIPLVKVCILLYLSYYWCYRQQMVRTSTAGGAEVQQTIQDYMFTSYKIYMKLQNHGTNDIQ